MRGPSCRCQDAAAAARKKALAIWADCDWACESGVRRDASAALGRGGVRSFSGFLCALLGMQKFVGVGTTNKGPDIVPG